jgi:hypothetical protein
MNPEPRSEKNPSTRSRARRLAAAVALAAVLVAALAAGLIHSTDAGAAGSVVTPVAPTFSDDVCSNFLATGASYTIPSTTGVDYVVNGAGAPAGTYNAADGATVTVTAQAQPGFSLTGTTTFTHTFAATPSCTTHVAAVAPTFTDDICTAGGSSGASYTVPATAGVAYLVNGVQAAAGTYPATDGTKVTILARALVGYSLTGPSSFVHTYAATCLTSATPAPPVFADDVCSGSAPAGASYLIPVTTGVDYLVNGVKTVAGTYPATDGSTVAVTAQSQAGFVLSGTTSFTHTFAAAPTCTTSVTPAAPSFAEDVCSGSTRAGATYTIPVKAGVVYLANGVKAAAGTYPATDGSTISITTSPQPGFALTGTTSFTHTFAAAPACTVAVTPPAPMFSDAACTGGAPSQALYTIPPSTGVDYFVNGIKAAAGSYNGTDGAAITITVLARAGYTLTGTTSFTHMFAATPTCTTSDCHSGSDEEHGQRGSRPCWVCRGWFSAHFRPYFEPFHLQFSRDDSHPSRRR